MDSRTGKQIRMGRLMRQPSGRTIIVAYSHGLLLGPQPGLRTLEDMRAVVHSCQAADGIMIGAGLDPTARDGLHRAVLAKPRGAPRLEQFQPAGAALRAG